MGKIGAGFRFVAKILLEFWTKLQKENEPVLAARKNYGLRFLAYGKTTSRCLPSLSTRNAAPLFTSSAHQNNQRRAFRITSARVGDSIESLSWSSSSTAFLEKSSCTRYLSVFAAFVSRLLARGKEHLLVGSSYYPSKIKALCQLLSKTLSGAQQRKSPAGKFRRTPQSLVPLGSPRRRAPWGARSTRTRLRRKFRAIVSCVRTARWAAMRMARRRK